MVGKFEFYIRLGLKIRTRREELGMSMAETALALGMESGRLAMYEYGVAEIYPETLLALSRVLNVRTDYFFEEFE